MTAVNKTSAISSTDRIAATSAGQLFDRPTGGDRAVLVQLDQGDGQSERGLSELRALAESAGAEVVDTLVNRRDKPDPRYFLGKGKTEELAERIGALGADLVLVNHTLTPAQERNLEGALRCRVLDRTGLILDIFALRARSFEGKLQVELAQLRHIASRLVRGWSHLERQSGGIGTRGPGETQLEMDRRMLGHRIKQLEQRLAKVRRQREQGRQSRRKREVPTLSLVGYTNAGKSTLFNRLTTSEVYAADQLFATLDTTLRRLELPNNESAIIADTVGFIRDLPHQLVAAFRSTLEEVTEADLVLHVIDAADSHRREHAVEVERVLDEIGAGDMPVLHIYNKVDLLGGTARIHRDEQGVPSAVYLSAASGEGLDLLREAVAERVGSAQVHGEIRLPAGEGRLRARFFQLGEVVHERVTDEGESILEVILPKRELDRLYSNEGLSAPVQPLRTFA